MPLIEDADIQVHLPADKLKVEEIPEELPDVKSDAERIIRGHLAGVFSSAVLSGWTAPNTTPALIRAIAGRLAAALIYRTRYSEDDTGDPEFAQTKYAEAMALLMGVINGTLVLEEVTAESATQFNANYFWPNDTSDAPKFTMDQVF